MSAALTAGLILLGGCGGNDGEVVGHVPWALTAVSPDARTLTIVHEEPHCETEPGKIELAESTTGVRITVPEIGTGWTGACTADLRFTTSTIRLAAPLAARPLSQPGQSKEPEVGFFAPRNPGTKECTQLARLEPDAPARDVPWVARRVELCVAPLPAAARRLPILRRARAAQDELPQTAREAVLESSFVLRPELSRRISESASIWFVPGPRRSCVARLVKNQANVHACESTRTVARRGLFVPKACVRQRVPRTISLLGLVPSGVDRVRLVPKRGAARTARVQGGGWAAEGLEYPTQVKYSDVQLKTTYEKRSCLS